MTISNQVPKPGSPAAIALGCKCPVLDNGHGRGYMGMPDVFVYNETCPVYAQEIERLVSQMEKQK